MLFFQPVDGSLDGIAHTLKGSGKFPYFTWTFSLNGQIKFSQTDAIDDIGKLDQGVRYRAGYEEKDKEATEKLGAYNGK